MSSEIHEYLASEDNYQFADAKLDDFRLVRDRYKVDGDKPPFTLVDVAPGTEPTRSMTLVEDWLHVPSNRLIHVALTPDDFDVFIGTQQHMVFAFLNEKTDPELNIAPKEQWDAADRLKRDWLASALFTDTYTDFYLYGLYGLPMSYKLRSRCDYDLAGRDLTAVKAELTAIGYEFVGSYDYE